MYSDVEISKYILENISKPLPFVGSIAAFISDINSWGQMWLLIMIGIMVYDYIKNKRINTYFLVALLPILLGWALSEFGIKNIVGRERPFVAIPEFKTYMESINYTCSSGNSFPSGHTLVAFAGAYTLYKYNSKFSIYGYALAILVGLSRLIVGAHYLSDVIAGAGYGTLISVIANLLATKYSPLLNNLIPLNKDKFKVEKENEIR